MTTETDFRATVLDRLIAERGHLVVDGATGTELFARGLPAGDAPERMNIDMADAVQDMHRAYVDAGSDIILTNSFGGTRHRLALHKLDDRVVEINAAAARNARAVADASDRGVLVAGSMGPTGELIVPLGDLEPAVAADSFAEQAQGLTEGGADLLWIETMSSLEEIEAAIEGARRASDLPITVTLSFDTAGRTMMGVTGAQAAERLTALGVAAIGANCGNNLPETEAALAEIRANTHLPVISKANAGIPEWHGAELSYSGSPDIMGAHAHRMRAAGVQIVGGCCGNSPAHVAAIRGVLDGTLPVPDVEVHEAPDRGATDGAPRRGRRRRS
ncbi:MAG: betaine--homocysteine S-methyltransferase [Acidimicrobiales bacterium]|nr:betaine--homocysteine S-methyltransferase [Acidimicrobiales bacterium]